jgi:hyperosmotically inducible periplasmic protein
VAESCPAASEVPAGLSPKRFAIVVVGLGVLAPVSTMLVHIQPTSPANANTETQERKAGARITDAWITMKIHSQFVPDDALDDSNIDVDTANGVVTLSGTVAAEASRARTVAIAKATDGVKSVNDKLRNRTPRGQNTAGGEGRGPARHRWVDQIQDLRAVSDRKCTRRQ